MNKFISYASNFEDVMLWRALQSATPGFYVDIGAHHPLVDSVTMAFYERGWRGVNVEPIRDLHEMFVQDRPKDINICAAVAASSGNVVFHEVVGTGLSTTDSQIAERHRQAGYDIQDYQVPMVTLRDIYETHRISEVHFLKIDVEGSEEQVLRGAALDKIRPWVIVIEATEPNTQIPTHIRWEYLLKNEQYIFVYFDGVNRYYLSKEHLELTGYFKAPPNVFDNFIQYQYWDALLKCEQEQYKQQQYAQALQQSIQKITSSWTWRITKPFRAPRIMFNALRDRRKG